LHDAQCVLRCLVKKKALLPGGGSPEMAVSHSLSRLALTSSYPDNICFKAFAEALEVIPITLAENAGLNSIKVVTELRSRHANGETNVGVSIKRGGVGVMGGEVGGNAGEGGEGVMQPLLVSTSAIELAAETVKMILRIDDIALSR
jgi:T-complex protein 1 subunit delta